MNAELLLRAADAIESLELGSFSTISFDRDIAAYICAATNNWSYSPALHLVSPMPGKVKTTLPNGRPRRAMPVPDAAKAEAQLPGDALFYPSCWPRDWQELWRQTYDADGRGDQEMQAETAAELIRAYVRGEMEMKP